MNPTFDAFRLHDEQGLPLTVTLAHADKAGIFVNLAAFACDALYAAWPEERVRTTLQEACADNGRPFNWEDFRQRLATLWTETGMKPDPECWRTMKARLLENTSPDNNQQKTV